MSWQRKHVLRRKVRTSMRIQSRWTLRAVSLGLSLILASGELVCAVGQTEAPQASPAQAEGTQAQVPPAPRAEAPPAPLPDAPSSSPANQPSAVGQSSGDQGNAQPNGTEPKPVQPQNGQTPNNDQNPAQQSKPQEPAGTAAAQAAQTSGGAASKPAGMAIAPAKQRQVRSFLIKLGAIAGAGVAIGTVVALSKGSPSKPPGAR